MGTLISDIVLALLSYVAENERMNIKQRQAEGIAVAKEKGVKFGRSPVPEPENFYEVHRDWRAAKKCGLPQSTFFRKTKKFEEQS